MLYSWLIGPCFFQMKYGIYQASIMQSNPGKQDTYIGVTEMEFKTRYNQHISSFKLEHRLSTTTLSEHIWKLKKSKIDHTIKREILDKALSYSASTGRCNLCIAERINILYKRPTLNKQRELFCTCPHRLMSPTKRETAE